MNLLVSKHQRVLHLTLNRPEKRNALDSALCKAIVSAVGEAQNDSDTGCIMLTAAGSVFCAGMDLDETGTAAATDLATLHESLFSIGSQSVKPIVMAVNGAALGGGMGLVAQAHIVFAGEGASFGLPEIKVGLWPFLVYRSVTTAIGPRRALAVSLSGRPFNAQQACEWGLVHRVVPASEVEDRCRVAADRLAKASPLALSLGMQYVQQSAGKSWREAGELAASLRAKLMESADFEEGRSAFKQKREAHWPSMPRTFYDGKSGGHL